MRLFVPTSWIDAENAGPIKNLAAHIGLYRAFAAGDNGHRTSYEDYLRSIGKTQERIDEILAMRRKLFFGPPSYEPMPAVINEKGRFELTDGHHRAARLVFDDMAYGLVDVQNISPTFLQLVDNLQALYPELPRTLYQEVEHPYFSSWEVTRSSRRLALVFDALAEEGISPSDGNYLEVGSCTGRFCREFNRRGWRCFGVDLDRRVVAIAEYLNSVFGTKVTYRCSHNHEETLMGGPGWGVILSLSVFHSHHTGGEHERVAKIFRGLLDRCKVFVTDGDAPGRAYNGGVAWPQEQYQAWLTELAAPTHDVKSIGTTESRTVYLCKRR